MNGETPVSIDFAPADWHTCLERLTLGAGALEVRTSPEARAAMIHYLKELAAWNRAYNLTAVRRPADMVDRHLLDSLSVKPYLYGGRVADVGSGAGLPGIPLALACPQVEFVLMESRRKRVLFMRHVLRRLRLKNVTVALTRVEDYHADGAGFDCVIGRAFARLDKMLRLCAHLCTPEGRILAMKGRDPRPELRSVPAGVEIQGVHALQVPGVEGQRHAVILARRPEPKV